MSKVIIFDMDGTLIDSTKAICETINYMRLGLNLTPLSYSYIIEVINNPAKNYMIEFYGVDRISNNMMKIFEDEYQKNYFLYAKVYDEAMAVMEYCEDKNYAMAVASNAPNSSLEAILKNSKILDKFKMIIGASNKIPCKPAPNMLNLIMDSLGKQAIFIGDSYKDSMAAKNANIKYINVTWGRDIQILDEINCKNANEVIKNIG